MTKVGLGGVAVLAAAANQLAVAATATVMGMPASTASVSYPGGR